MNVDTSVIIRKAVNDDAATVHRFICELEEAAFSFKTFEEIFKANLLNKNNIYLVAESADVVAGFISCHVQLLLHHAGWVGEIQELFVAREMRGNGTGAKLVQRLKDELLARGVQAVEVTAQLRRTDTHQFYLRAGFENTHKKFVLTL
jgi:(aminoalkyl)phosphonate N-acetyltransferase